MTVVRTGVRVSVGQAGAKSLVYADPDGTVVTIALTGGGLIEINRNGLAPLKNQVTMTFGRVTDTAINTHSLPVKALTAIEWVDGADADASGGTLTAPWVGSITTTGARGNAKANPPAAAIAGDFSAAVVLSGQGVAPKALTLGTVKVAGSIIGSAWGVDGDLGTLSVGVGVDGWTLRGTDDGDAVGLANVKSLTLGSVLNSVIDATGVVGALKASKWDGGSITADSLVSLATTGRKQATGVAALPGDFTNATLTLRGNATPARGKATITALGSANIAGNLVGSAWSVDMDAGAIKVGGVVDGRTLAGAADGDSVDLVNVRSLTLGDVAAASVTVKTASFIVTSAKGQVNQVVGGVLGAVKALRWAAGTIEADSLASLTITGRGNSGRPGAIPGDLGATVVLTGQVPAGRKPTAGAVSIANDLTASVWQITGSMTTRSVTHIAQHSTVVADGNIDSISLGASYDSRFMAGVKGCRLDPQQVSVDDLNAGSRIGSVTIKGLPSKPLEAPDFLTDSSFLAPSLGTVNLLNGTPGTWDLFAQAGTLDLQIKAVTHKDTRDPHKAWTWAPGTGVPPGGVGGPSHPIM